MRDPARSQGRQRGDRACAQFEFELGDGQAPWPVLARCCDPAFVESDVDRRRRARRAAGAQQAVRAANVGGKALGQAAGPRTQRRAQGRTGWRAIVARQIQGRRLEGDVRRAARADFIRQRLNGNGNGSGAGNGG